MTAMARGNEPSKRKPLHRGGVVERGRFVQCGTSDRRDDEGRFAKARGSRRKARRRGLIRITWGLGRDTPASMVPGAFIEHGCGRVFCREPRDGARTCASKKALLAPRDGEDP